MKLSPKWPKKILRKRQWHARASGKS